MKTGTLKRSLILGAFLSTAFLVGCELIVDFDRTRIPADVTEGGTADVLTPSDATADADATAADADAGDADASDDAPADAPADG